MITDITEDVTLQQAVANGLVYIKVCAVDEVWSGLKLVIPVNRNLFLLPQAMDKIGCW